ncbi:MAG: hypothetical protein IMF11_07250 [Proteobacteria bacterium]|nr:hypothetical protein [Pseudomonadota bacterium]
MKKKVIFLLIILLCFFLSYGGSAPLTIAGASAGEIKACQVRIPLIENIYTGKESISLAPNFEISNPNNFPVTVKELEYEIFLKDMLCDGKNLILNYYIPAKGKIVVSSAFPVTWVDMVLWVWQTKGVSMSDAIKEVLPIWKNLNGKLFNPKLKKLWDQIPSEHPLFNLKGQINIIGPGGKTLASEYSTTWSMSDGYWINK